MHIKGLMMAIVIGMALNLDNIGIGLSYGARRIQIPRRSVLLMALMSLLAALVGGFSGAVLTSFLGSAAEFIGSTILMCLGVSIIVQTLVIRKQSGTKELNLAKHMNTWELSIIATSQSITDLVVGFGTEVSHINVVITALSIGVFSVLFLSIPAFVGRKYRANWLGNSAAVISGLLLIAVGLHQY